MHITKSIGFDAGHRLMKHESKCKNVHGHRYTVELTVGGQGADEVGRIIDFSVIKDQFGGWIDRNLDHGFIYQEGDWVGETLASGAARDMMKVFMVPFPPTAEFLAAMLWHVARFTLPELHIISVVLWETPTSRAMVNGVVLDRQLVNVEWHKLIK